LKLFKVNAAKILYSCMIFLIICGWGCSEDDPLVVVVESDSKTLELQMRRWVPASPPVDPADSLGFRKLEGDKRDKIFWYNIEPAFGTRMRDLNPNLSERDNILVRTLDVELDNTSIDPDVWVGVMTGFYGCGLDLREYENLAIWINDFKPDPQDRGGRLYIDIGKIDEDFFEPDLNVYNDEDRNRDGFTALTEDTGLDGLSNEDGDLSDDDYDVQRDIDGRFSRINGTEGNFLHDTEDINRSGSFDKKNCYFAYSINLADTAVWDIRRDFPTYEGFSHPGHERDAWRKYIIDMSGGTSIHLDCAASLCNVRHIRIWFRNVSATVDPGIRRIQVAIIKFTK
jgi:hypothetical protein